MVLGDTGGTNNGSSQLPNEMPKDGPNYQRSGGQTRKGGCWGTASLVVHSCFRLSQLSPKTANNGKQRQQRQTTANNGKQRQTTANNGNNGKQRQQRQTTAKKGNKSTKGHTTASFVHAPQQKNPKRYTTAEMPRPRKSSKRQTTAEPRATPEKVRNDIQLQLDPGVQEKCRTIHNCNVGSRPRQKA